MKMGLSIPWSDSYHNNCFNTPIFFKILEIILLENWQGIDPMGLSATLAKYKPNHTSQTQKCHQQP